MTRIKNIMRFINWDTCRTGNHVWKNGIFFKVLPTILHLQYGNGCFDSILGSILCMQQGFLLWKNFTKIIFQCGQSIWRITCGHSGMWGKRNKSVNYFATIKIWILKHYNTSLLCQKLHFISRNKQKVLIPILKIQNFSLVMLILMQKPF